MHDTRQPASSQSRRTFVGASAAALAGLALRAPARADQITFKLGHNTPEGQAQSVRTRQMAAEVAKSTNGSLDIQVFGGGSLGTDAAILTQVRSGAIQMCLVGSPYLGTVVPQAQMDSVPFAYANSTVALRAFNGKLGEWLRQQIRANMGIIALDGTWDTGFRQVGGARAVTQPSDLDGFKIRVPPAKLFIDTFKTLGASPVPVDYAQMYTALQTHIIDGNELPLDFIEYGHFFEVEKYLNLTYHMWGARWMLVNLDAWNGLSKDQQAALTAASLKYAGFAHRDTELLDAAIPDKLKRRGMIVSSVDRDAFRKKLGPAFYNRWRDEFGAVPWGLMEQYTGPLAT